MTGGLFEKLKKVVGWCCGEAATPTNYLLPSTNAVLVSDRRESNNRRHDKFNAECGMRNVFRL